MCVCLCSCFIVGINIIFLIIGLVFIAAGGILISPPSAVQDMINNLIKDALGSISNEEIKNLLNEVLSTLKFVPTSFIIIGVISLGIALIAFMSACCKYRSLLIVYIILLAMLVIGQIGFVVIVYTNESIIKGPLTTELQKIIKNDFKGFNSTEPANLLLSVVQVLFGCCGAYNGSDFESALNWKRVFTEKVRYKDQEFDIKIKLMYPLSCCRMENFKPVNISACANEGKEVNTRGCVQKLFDDLREAINQPYIIAPIASLIGIQVILLLGAIIIFTCHKPKVEGK